MFKYANTQKKLAQLFCCRNSLGQSHPCGSLKPNDLGLFDMHGNVSQWTQGVFGNKPIDKEVDGSEVVSGASFRVSRGGSWYDDAGSCRAANRFRPSPDDRTTFLCRCAVSFFHPELVGSWLKRGGKA